MKCSAVTKEAFEKACAALFDGLVSTCKYGLSNGDTCNATLTLMDALRQMLAAGERLGIVGGDGREED